MIFSKDKYRVFEDKYEQIQYFINGYLFLVSLSLILVNSLIMYSDLKINGRIWII